MGEVKFVDEVLWCKPAPKPNTELSFGAHNGEYDFVVSYRRAKPLNRFQQWMFKVCFGIRAKNVGEFE